MRRLLRYFFARKNRAGCSRLRIDVSPGSIGTNFIGFFCYFVMAVFFVPLRAYLYAHDIGGGNCNLDVTFIVNLSIGEALGPANAVRHKTPNMRRVTATVHATWYCRFECSICHAGPV